MNQGKMKAVFCTKYGQANVLTIKDTPKPSPKEGEVLIKVIVAAITTADTMMRKGEPRFARLFLGWNKPKNPIIGTGFAGVIEQVGSKVNNFKVGDEVFGETGLVFSSNAEYVSIPSDGLILHKPKKLSFEEAAPLCDGVLTSFNFLKNLVTIKEGDHVLINGASGSLGLAAVQIAKLMGANVTGVCSNKNIELVQSLGADIVIDYSKQDFTKSNQKYNVIYDTIGLSSFKKCKKILSIGGTYISPVLNIKLLFQMMWTSFFGKKKAIFQATGLQPIPQLKEMLHRIIPILENKKVKIFIDKKYALKDVVKAHDYVDTSRKRGNIVLLMNH